MLKKGGNPISQDCDYKKIGQRLKELRGSLSQSAFGKPLGYKYSYVKNVEHGTKPSLEYLIKVAEYYNASLDWLLRGVAQNNANCEEISPKQQKVEAVFDPDLKIMIDVLQNLMLDGDPDLRGWTKIQFKRAFGEQPAAAEEKKHHA